MHRLVWSIALVFVISAGLSAAENNVLIIKEDTSYKKALVAKLIKNLEDDNTTIMVVDHRRESIKDIDPSDYDAVFVTNSGAQAMVRPKVLSWLRSISGRDDNVILHTTQTTNWKPPVEVDSITTASLRSNIDDLVEDISRKIRSFL